MLKILGESQIIFVNAERGLVFAQNVQVPLVELDGCSAHLDEFEAKVPEAICDANR